MDHLLAPPTTPRTPRPYEDLFRRHFPELVRLAALLGADDPADLAQEAFVRLHRRNGLLRDDGAALAYARRTVVNLTHSRLRHLRVVRRAQPALLPPPGPSAEDVVVQQDENTRLLAALGTLRPRQQELLVLRYWLDLSGPEIAAVLNIPLGTVKSQTARALGALHTILEVRR